MLKRLKGHVYNAVVQALEKTTTKNNWQRLNFNSDSSTGQLCMRVRINGLFFSYAPLTSCHSQYSVLRVKSYSHVDQRKADAVYTKD